MIVNKFTDIELTIVLAHFLFKDSKMSLFIQKMKDCFNKEYSETDLLRIEVLFDIVNPANNRDAAAVDTQIKDIWNRYSSEESRKSLRKFYGDFKNKRIITYPKVYDDGYILSDYAQDYSGFEDLPKSVPDYVIVDGKKQYKRNQDVLNNALISANYKCEGNCRNDIFVKKDGKTPYTEGHHLIPLKVQDYFSYSLDVEANIVSLCPYCHRLLHYGFYKTELLEKLFVNRKERLKLCNIDISFEQLLLFYE